MGETTTLTVELSAETKAALAALAEATGRSEALLTSEAIQRYLEYDAWYVAEVEQALREADAGDFATEEEVDATFTRLQAKYRKL